MRTGGDYRGGGPGWQGGIGPQGPGPGRGPSGSGMGPQFDPPLAARGRPGSLIDGLRDLLRPNTHQSDRGRFADLAHAFSDDPGARGGWQYVGGGRAVWTGPYQGDMPTARQLKALERAFAIPTALAMGSFGVIPGLAAFFGMRHDIRKWMRFVSQDADKNRMSNGKPRNGANLPYYGFPYYGMMNMPGIWDPAAMASNLDPAYMGSGAWMGGPYAYGMGGMGFPFPVPFPYPYPMPPAGGTTRATQTGHAQPANNARFHVAPDGQVGHHSGRPWRLSDAGKSWHDVFRFAEKPTQAHIDLRYLALRNKVINAPGADAKSTAEDLDRLDAFYQDALRHFGHRGAGTSGHSPFRP